MKALTVRQPWAWAIIHGAKDVENRDWKPRVHPGRIAIHAGREFDGEDAWSFVQDRTDVPFISWDVARGAIIGTVAVVDIHSPAQSALQGRWGGCVVHGCHAWGMDSIYHWVLTDPQPLLEPIPCKGSLGLWPVPDALVELLAGVR